MPLLDSEFAGARANMLRFDCRAVLAVPLMREGGAYGAIVLARHDAGLFPPDQVALIETFGRQAAIAIDNVRLFNQTKEALDQQTAISEILRVISNSPGDVKPMLAAVAERALRLCDAMRRRSSCSTRTSFALPRDSATPKRSTRERGWRCRAGP